MGCVVTLNPPTTPPTIISDVVNFLVIKRENPIQDTLDLENDMRNILLSMKREPKMESMGEINVNISRYSFKKYWKISK